MKQTPLILITNDDGIQSPGLTASVAACASLGELLIVAPAHQQSAAGRAKPPGSSGRMKRQEIRVEGGIFSGYAIEGSPAQMVEHALVELATRPIDLVVSGINYGENIGEGITTSGTVAAALEAASFGIAALAVSRQTAPEHYYTHSAEIDFDVAGHFVQIFARQLLEVGLPQGVDLLKVDVPANATTETPWRWTRISRKRYFYPTIQPRRNPDAPSPLGFITRADRAELEPDSDIWAVALDQVVSVAPVNVDMTASTPSSVLAAWAPPYA